MTSLYTRMFLAIFLAAAVASVPDRALAHGATDQIGGLVSGFLHPLLGFDHLLAMLAVGIWGAQMGGASVWSLPVAFPLIMALGGAAGAAGLSLPGVEVAIALSVMVLGLAILAAWKAPGWLALAMISVFAVFHGHAHGAELPAAADPLAYGLGFVVSTGLIHLAGIAFGLFIGSLLAGRVSRAAGAAMAAIGIAFLVS